MQPNTLVIELLSDTTVASTSSHGVLVDTEVDHDPSTGLPRIHGKTLHGLLTESWQAMKPYFSDLDQTSERVLGKANDHQETSILHIDTAYPPALKAIRDRGLPSEHILKSLTNVRRQHLLTVKRVQQMRGHCARAAW